MLRSINSHDDHDDHLRHLLDQRNARTDFHTRFPSLSDFPDSPSVYSHALFSPRPSDGHSSSGAYKPEPEYGRRVNNLGARDRFNDPAASILDLDDDHRSSYDSNDSDVDEQPDHDDQPQPRMSLLGPKMRVHSRAPWEMEDDTLQEEDDSDNSVNYITSGSPAFRGKSHIRKGLGFRSATPRTSDGSRPSGESTRSQGRVKKSLEMSNPRSALQALAQASISSSSLVPNISRQQAARNMFSSSRVRPQTPTSTHTPSPLPSPNSGPMPYFSSIGRSSYSNPSPEDPLGRSVNSHSSHEEDENLHPYANPDLVTPYARDLPTQSPLRSTFAFPRSDSNTTVTDSVNLSILSKTGTRSTLTPDTSTSSVGREQSPRSRSSTFQGKEISSPITIQVPLRSTDTNATRDARMMPSLPSSPATANLPGWTERSASPTFTLISLEEARAQRSRSITTQATTNSSGSRMAPVTDHDVETTSMSFDSSQTGSIASRARARSISAGARAKHVLQNVVGGPSSPKIERRDLEPVVHQQQMSTSSGAPAKGLKHKKSGFMRLFNSREKEKEDRAPPVPSISDVYAAYSAQAPQKSKITTHRIPVPPLSPSLLEGSSTEGPSSTADLHPHGSMEDSGYLDPRDALTSRKPSPSPKRTPPPLSINTTSQGQPLRSTASAVPHQSLATPFSTSEPDGDWSHSQASSASAPPNVTDFPALKLRPISTMFSSHFGDHIVTRPSLEADSETSTSPGTAFSPITPGLMLRSDPLNVDKSSRGMSVISEDQSSVIEVLQEQIISARKAWQRHIWELEGQVRDLKAEVEDLKALKNDKEYCASCKRGLQHHSIDTDQQPRDGTMEPKKAGIVNRPRARTGLAASRFGSGV